MLWKSGCVLGLQVCGLGLGLGGCGLVNITVTHTHTHRQTDPQTHTQTGLDWTTNSEHSRHNSASSPRNQYPAGSWGKCIMGTIYRTDKCLAWNDLASSIYGTLSSVEVHAWASPDESPAIIVAMETTLINLITDQSQDTHLVSSVALCVQCTRWTALAARVHRISHNRFLQFGF